MGNKLTLFTLLAILLISFFLRTYDINEIFKSSDEIEIANVVIQHFPRSIESLNFLDETKKISNPLCLFLQSHNVLIYLLGLVTFIFYTLFQISITEFSWNLPLAFLGTLNIILIYLLAKFLSNKQAALISSLFFGLIPLLIYNTRIIGLSLISLPFFFLILVVYLFCRYFQKPSRKNAIMFSISLTLYIATSLIFPLIFFLILFMGVYFQREKRGKSYPFFLLFKEVLKKLIRLEVLFLPIIALYFLIVTNLVNFIFHKKFIGVIGHTIHAPSAKFGFFPINFIEAFKLAVGWVCFLIIIFCLLIILFNFKKIKRCSIFLAWFGIYSLPFLFVFPRAPWTIAHFLIEALGGLIILVSIVISDLDKFFSKINVFSINLTRSFLIIIVALSFLLGNFSFIFEIDTPKVFEIGQYGSFETKLFPIKEDFGIKAAGYWIRKNTDMSTLIFSNYYRGGAGIEPPNADYYFHRNTYCIYDGNDERGLELFERVKDKVEVLVLDAENIEIFEDRLEGFNKVVNIIDKNGKIKLIIYSQKLDILTNLSITKGNEYFDIYFSDFDSMIDCPNCNSAQLIYSEMNPKL